MHRHALAPIRTARSLVSDERAEVEVERRALEAFADRVDAVSPRKPATATGLEPAGAPSALQHGAESPHARLLSAYRETVMAVDHYPEVYDEPLAVNMSAELGPDVASGLGNGAPFTPAFKRLVETAVDGALEQRELVIETLDAEADSLARSLDALESIVTALEARGDGNGEARPADPPSSLRDLETRFQSVLDERCEVIQSRPLPGRLDGHDLCAYMYRSTAWTYPVLTVGATVARDLRALRERRDV